MHKLYDHPFELPVLPKDVDAYARSVQQHGQITARMAEEGMRVFDAYLGLHLPPYLPKRDA
jgi:hypothetical protein